MKKLIFILTFITFSSLSWADEFAVHGKYFVTWETPQIITQKDAGKSYIGFDKQGNLFVFWKTVTLDEQMNVKEEEIGYKKWDGQSWGKEKYFSKRDGVNSHLRGVYSDIIKGNIHVILAEDKSDNIGIIFSLHYQKWDGEFWSEPIKLCDRTGSGRTSICSDNKGFVHLFYGGRYTPGEKYITVSDLPFAVVSPTKLFYKKYDGKSWQNDIEINKRGIGGRYWAREPSAVVDDQGTLHVVWLYWDIPTVLSGLSTETHKTKACYQSGNETNWTDEKKLSGPGQDVIDTKIILDSAGKLYVIWSTLTGDIFHRLFSKGKWTKVDKIGDGVSFSLCSDSRGNVHLVSLTTEGRLIYRMWDGSSWKEGVNLFPDVKGARSPYIATDSSNNVFLSWTLPDTGKIFFVRGKIVKE